VKLTTPTFISAEVKNVGAISMLLHIKMLIIMKILDGFYILGYNFVESKPTFRRNMIEAVVGHEACSKESLASHFLSRWFLAWLILLP
jgi:hypothetical protein